MNDGHLLYLLGPSSKQNVRVKVASSSKNSVANASHQRLSLSCNTMQGCKYCPLPENLSTAAATTTRKCVVSLEREACFDNIIVAAGIGQPECVCVYIYTRNASAVSFSAYSMPPRCNFRPRGSLVYHFSSRSGSNAPCCLHLPNPSTSPKLYSPLLSYNIRDDTTIFNPREKDKVKGARKREVGIFPVVSRDLYSARYL